ncbi:MAG: oligopeptide transport system permease protein [Thermomicrobiales bacterium]|nr:oligopeptide transport system permease protein [Thermomicrobiales bacterium]
MRTFLIRRLLSFFPTMLLFYTLVFVLIQLTPGNPWDTSEKPFRREVLQALEEKYHYNDPVWKQYVDYLERVFFHFDFGPSYKRNVDANEIVERYFPVSLQLGAVAFAIAVVCGVGLGVVSAIKQNTLTDHLAMLFSVIGVATPSFVVITLMVIFLAVNLGWLPAFGWDGVFSTKIIIPAIALSLGPMAVIARYTRASMLETIRMDFVRTARAKGLAERPIMVRHALRNALIPVVTVSGLALADLITGSFFVEAIYGVPGIGRYFVSTVADKDYPVLMAVTLLFAALIWLMNFLADVTYALIDPRVKVS